MAEAQNIAVDVGLLERNPGMVADLFRQLKVTPSHPTLPLPSHAQVVGLLRQPGGKDALRQGLLQREQIIAAMREDPLRHGFEGQAWRDADALLAGTFAGKAERGTPHPQPLSPSDAERVASDGAPGVTRPTRRLKDLLVLGGNRAAKSEWAAKRCVQKLVSKPGAIVWALSTTAKTSIRDQQKLIWKYLPAEWKSLKKTSTTRITYNQKDGFADSAFVLPNGSEMQFMNYKQDRDVIEGGQVDLWWADELIPVDWVVTLRGRTIDRHGQGIVTFTPIRGCSATVAEYITGAKVIAWTVCELLLDQKLWPGGDLGQVPYIMECLNPEHAVIYFQSKQNPFVDYEELKKVWAKRSRSDILVRLHGVTEKRTGNIFPRFGTHNIIPHDKIPLAGTNWHFGDFAWNRKWFMIWFRVWEEKGKKRIFVYREWPDMDTYGEWAIASELPDGERGPAQETLGYGINDYKRLVFELEKNKPTPHPQSLSPGEAEREAGGEAGGEAEEIFERYGDPRSGAVVSLQEEKTTSIFELLNEDADGLPGLDVKPVAMTGTRRFIGEGVNLINEWLQYDEEKPITLENEPMLYISDRCRNVAECLKLWTGNGGEKGASKDPVDLLRYAAVMDIDYRAPGALLVTGGMG